jgi:hypothetical protein
MEAEKPMGVRVEEGTKQRSEIAAILKQVASDTWT